MKYFSVMNVIHTRKGILQGFSFRYLNFKCVLFNKFVSIKIPYKILGYNKEHAQKLDKLILVINQDRIVGRVEEKEND